MNRRKQIFTSIILAIILLFSMVGCKTKKKDEEPPIQETVNVSDVLTSSVNQLMKKDSFSADFSFTMEKEYNKRVISISLKVVKTETGYDFEINGEADSFYTYESEENDETETEVEKNYTKMYKIGNLVYTKNWDNESFETEGFNPVEEPYYVQYTKEIDNIVTIVKDYVEPALPDVKDLIDKINNSSKLDKNDNGYTISLGKDYTEDFKSLLTELKDNEDTQIFTYILSKLVANGYTINLQDLQNAISTICDDEVTIGTTITEVDKLIQIFVPTLSIKDIVNSICSIANLNAQDLYDNYIKDTDLEDTFTTEPTENQTVYDYINDTAKDMPILLVLKNILDDEEFSLTGIKDEALELLTKEENTVKSVVEELISIATPVLDLFPNLSDIDLDYDFVFDFDTLVNMNVEKTEASLVTKFDSNYNLEKFKVDLVAKAETNDEEPIKLSNFSLNVNLDFNYDTVTVSLPDNILYWPYIESEEFYIDDIQANMENGITIKYNKADYSDIKVSYIWRDSGYIPDYQVDALEAYITIDKEKNEITLSKQFFVKMNDLANQYPEHTIGITFALIKDASGVEGDEDTSVDLDFNFREYKFSLDLS